VIGSDSAREVVICASCGADEMWNVRSSSASAANDAATSVVTTTYDSTRAIDDYAGTTRGGQGMLPSPPLSARGNSPMRGPHIHRGLHPGGML